MFELRCLPPPRERGRHFSSRSAGRKQRGRPPLLPRCPPASSEVSGAGFLAKLTIAQIRSRTLLFEAEIILSHALLEKLALSARGPPPPALGRHQRCPGPLITASKTIPVPDASSETSSRSTLTHSSFREIHLTPKNRDGLQFRGSTRHVSPPGTSRTIPLRGDNSQPRPRDAPRTRKDLLPDSAAGQR